MSYLPFTFFAALLFYVQSLGAETLPICPDFGPVLAVYLGAYARRDRLAVAALLLGVLRAALDLEPVGIQILLALAISSAISTVRDAVFTDRLFTQWVLAFVGGALHVVLHAGFGLLVPLGGAPGGSGLLIATLGAIAGTAVAPFVFAPLRLLRIGP